MIMNIFMSIPMWMSTAMYIHIRIHIQTGHTVTITGISILKNIHAESSTAWPAS